MCAVEGILDLLAAASYGDCADSGFDSHLLILAAHQRVQVYLSHRSDGLGVESSQHGDRSTRALGQLGRGVCARLPGCSVQHAHCPGSTPLNTEHGCRRHCRQRPREGSAI